MEIKSGSVHNFDSRSIIWFTQLWKDFHNHHKNHLLIYLLNKYLLLLYCVLSAFAGDTAVVKKGTLNGQPRLPRTQNHSLYCVNIAIQECGYTLLTLVVEVRHWRIAHGHV